MRKRNTKQKKIISNEVSKFKTFFAAEDLHENVKLVDGNIGLATIYRFLKKLRQDGKIFSYTCDGKLVYSIDNKSHCHFVCEETNKVIHIDVDSLDFLKDKIPGSITNFQIEIRGICNKCSKS